MSELWTTRFPKLAAIDDFVVAYRKLHKDFVANRDAGRKLTDHDEAHVLRSGKYKHATVGDARKAIEAERQKIVTDKIELEGKIKATIASGAVSNCKDAEQSRVEAVAAVQRVQDAAKQAATALSAQSQSLTNMATIAADMHEATKQVDLNAASSATQVPGILCIQWHGLPGSPGNIKGTDRSYPLLQPLTPLDYLVIHATEYREALGGI